MTREPPARAGRHEGFDRPGDTHFAFLIPERAFEDQEVLRAAMRIGLVSPRLAASLLMTDFANHLHNRYLLRFQPKNPNPGLHEVRERIKGHGNLTVLARRSYWVEDPDKVPQ